MLISCDVVDVMWRHQIIRSVIFDFTTFLESQKITTEIYTQSRQNANVMENCAIRPIFFKEATEFQ